MADEPNQQETPDAAAPKKNSVLIPVIIVLVGCISAALGFCVPMAWGPAEENEQLSADVTPTPGYVPFGETVVNLDEGRLNRYLRIGVTLLVDKDEEEELTALVEERRKLLKSWLISYLADKDMESIRGAAGQNRVRRDILDHFNETLFENDVHRIHDVLFEDFNIQ